MTLDEAIEHAKEVAETCDDSGCAADHIQLAEWLRQVRGTGKAARWYTGRIQELEAENAKLRKENERFIIKLKAEHIVRQNVVSENANLRELCERCAIELYTNGNVTDAATENLFDDMRKLGIEVDS